MNQNQINSIVHLHQLWLQGYSDGRCANFCGENLRGKNFSEANLTEGNFSEANLCGADFCGAKLYGARFNKADLTKALYNNRTTFPVGFDPVSAGMFFVGGKEKQEAVEVVASPNAPTTLREELSAVFAKHGFELVSLNFTIRTKV